MFNQHNHRLTSFPVPYKIALQQTVQYESPGRFSSPSGQCNFVVKNHLRNSSLYNCCCHFAQSCSTCHSQRQARRQGGFEGVRSNPPFGFKRFYIHCFNCTVKCPTVGKWFTSSLATIENHRCPSKAGCSYAGLFLEDQRRMRTRKLFTPL